jgi:hypothetical protein
MRDVNAGGGEVRVMTQLESRSFISFRMTTLKRHSDEHSEEFALLRLLLKACTG